MLQLQSKGTDTHTTITIIHVPLWRYSCQGQGWTALSPRDCFIYGWIGVVQTWAAAATVCRVRYCRASVCQRKNGVSVRAGRRRKRKGWTAWINSEHALWEIRTYTHIGDLWKMWRQGKVGSMLTRDAKVCHLMVLSLKGPVMDYFSFSGKVLSQKCRELRTLGKQKTINGTKLIWETVNSRA